MTKDPMPEKREWWIDENPIMESDILHHSDPSLRYPRESDQKYLIKVISSDWVEAELAKRDAIIADLEAALEGAAYMFKAIEKDTISERGLGCDDKRSSYGHSNACILSDLKNYEDVMAVNEALEKLSAIRKGNG